MWSDINVLVLGIYFSVDMLYRSEPQNFWNTSTNTKIPPPLMMPKFYKVVSSDADPDPPTPTRKEVAIIHAYKVDMISISISIWYTNVYFPGLE